MHLTCRGACRNARAAKPSFIHAYNIAIINACDGQSSMQERAVLWARAGGAGAFSGEGEGWPAGAAPPSRLLLPADGAGPLPLACG
jgi:hypothetical protein